jgi:ABC-type Fe3+ transport system substrate-binding protein
MRHRFSQILIFSVLVVLLSACVEKAQPAAYQYLHLYTDFPKTINNTFFRDFVRKNKIQVLIHYKSSDKIIKQILDKKYESGIDIVLLRNPLDMLELKEKGCLYTPKDGIAYYQSIINDPYVFQFPNDTIPLFTSYGQIFRNDRVKIIADTIANEKEWINLLGGLIKKYPKINPSDIYRKIMRSDTLIGRDLKVMRIAPYSSILDKKSITFPDQYYKGTVGKISGIAIIRNGKHMNNNVLLYNYCTNEWWRKKLAEKLKLFPILDEELAKKAEYLLYQDILTSSDFVKRLKM